VLGWKPEIGIETGVADMVRAARAEAER